MTILEGKRVFHISAPLSIVEEAKELAWEGAKKHIRVRDDMAWLVSQLLTSSPEGNTNGHIFPLEDLKNTHQTVVHTPVNMGHRDEYIVGHCVAAELLYPVAAATAVETDQVGADPGVDTLSTFYKALFPTEFAALKRAHAQGASWVSMECTPKDLICMAPGGCGKTYPYDGTQSPTYCDELNQPRAKKILSQPIFRGQGIILPPQRPGWKRADITQIDALIAANVEEAERLRAEIETAGDDLTEDVIMQLMLQLLAGAFGPVPEISSHRYMPSKKKRPAMAEADLEVASELLVETAAAQRGVIVALVPPTDVAEALAALGDEPAEQKHVTIAFLGSTGEDGTIDGHTLEEVSAAVAAFASGAPSLGVVKVSGLGRFAVGEGSEVTYASIDAPELPEFRARLVAALEAAGIPVSHEHGSSPHVTIQYSSPGTGPTEMPGDLSWTVDHIELWWGDAEHRSYQLADGRVPFANETPETP